MSLIIAIIFFTLGMVTILVSAKDTYSSAFGIVLILASMVLSVIYLDSQPKAIDVYRGNTTIQVTYKDSIPIDTVVVFKSEK